MDKKQIILWVSIAAGGYLAYWYVTTHGPSGQDAAGNLIGPSYWDTWFGSSTAVTATPAHPATGIVAATPSVPGIPIREPSAIVPDGGIYRTGTPITPTPVIPTGPRGRGGSSTGETPMRDLLLSASGGVNQLNSDQWNYYVTQITGVTQTGSFFDPSNRGELMDVDTYLARRVAQGQGLSGVGDIVSIPSTPPSMSFGGGLRKSMNMQGRRPSGGGYIQ